MERRGSQGSCGYNRCDGIGVAIGTSLREGGEVDRNRREG